MTTYVVGIAFDQERKSIVLIEKQRPEWQKGKLNGPGGQIEPGENISEAMVREFFQETSIMSLLRDWGHFLTLNGNEEDSENNWKVHFLVTDSLDIDDAQTVTDEHVDIYEISEILQGTHAVIENIPWIILLAIDYLEDRRPGFVNAEYYPNR